MPDSRRTFADYKAAVLHALGNPDEAELDISPAAIVNDAIEHLATVHEWNWLSTGEVSLDIVADQNYVALPPDYGTLVAVEHDQGWARVMIPTTWPEMLAMRSDQIQQWSRSYWYLVNTGNVTDGQEEQGLAAPRLELYPTPADDFAGGLRLVYRRFLRRLVNDGDVPQWPAYMDRPASLLARCFAATDYDENPESAYTQEFRTLLADCMTKDGLSRRSFGQPRSGLYPRTIPVSPFYPVSIPDPTMA